MTLLGGIVLLPPSPTATAEELETTGLSEPMSLSPIGERNPLQDAVRKGDIAQVGQLLATDADVNVTDTLGRAPLHYASRLGEAEIVAMLLDAGAAVDIQDNDGFTPLLRAVQGGHQDVTVMLLERGADVAARSKGGLTAAEIATGAGDSAMRELLERYRSAP